ncbi:MAG: c-type cytochrome [Flavobacteriales bacterium]
MKHAYKIFGFVALSAVVFSSCSEDDNSPGVEYMPDMYRSPALEAYVDYGDNTRMDWTEVRKSEDPEFKRRYSLTPPVGTVPYMGSDDMAKFAFPYPLNNTPEDYERSTAEIKSPILPTETNIKRGKEIYTLMCTHCHGKEGHGDGKISQNGFIQGIPDYATKLKDLPEGKMFHTLTHGKGLMGQHASQLNQQERWQVVEYVKCLQQGVAEPEFDANGLKKVSGTTAEADTTKKD